MPEFATKGKPRDSASHSDSIVPPLRVHYYRQMKPQRVYTVQVAWKKSDSPPHGAGREITLRLIVAGAQVLPSEQTLDAAQPGAKALFYVTPLAKGWLRNQKLEVLANGRKVQEVPMATKVVTQRLTWLLLFCTFFIPWFITEYIKNSPMNDPIRNKEGSIITKPISKQVSDFIKHNVPATPKDWKGNAIDTGINESRDLVAHGYQQLVSICNIMPIAFYVGLILLFFTLISAFLHMQKRGRATGKPITLPAARGVVDEAENEA